MEEGSPWHLAAPTKPADVLFAQRQERGGGGLRASWPNLPPRSREPTGAMNQKLLFTVFSHSIFSELRCPFSDSRAAGICMRKDCCKW